MKKKWALLVTKASEMEWKKLFTTKKINKMLMRTIANYCHFEDIFSKKLKNK